MRFKSLKYIRIYNLICPNFVFTKTSIFRVRSKYGFIEVEIKGEIFFNKRRFFAQEIFLERDTFK